MPYYNKGVSWKKTAKIRLKAKFLNINFFTFFTFFYGKLVDYHYKRYSVDSRDQKLPILNDSNVISEERGL
jgi:hypothetical protein